MSTKIMILKILAFGLLFSCMPEGRSQNSLLWQITSKQGEVSYLFGTYHLIGNEYLNAHPQVAEAYKKSEITVVETLIDSTKLMEVASMSLMTKNTLWDFYDTAEFELINQVIEEQTGMNLNVMTQMKPVAIAMFYSLSLAQQELQDSELDFSGQPIDVYFASQAKKRGKTVVTLETMMEQMRLLYDSDSLQEQATMLLKMVEDTTVESLNIDLLRLYKSEDLTGMYQLSEDQGDSYGDMSIFLEDRNHKWIEKLVPVLEQGEAFIAVGALHLPGKEGLIALLSQEGYELKPIMPN